MAKKKTTEQRWPSRTEHGLRLTGADVWLNAMAYDHAPVVALANHLVELAEATYDGNPTGLSCAATRRVAKQMRVLAMFSELVGAYHFETKDNPDPLTLTERDAAWDHWLAKFELALKVP